MSRARIGTTILLMTSGSLPLSGQAASAAQPETVEIFAAGSLRGVVGELAKEAGPLLDIEVQPSFGGSGSMRERIEKGESPDLFMSADIGSPRKLEAESRGSYPSPKRLNRPQQPGVPARLGPRRI